MTGLTKIWPDFIEDREKHKHLRFQFFM